MINATAPSFAPPLRSAKTEKAEQPTQQEPKDWTVLMYLNGDNDAEERITRALLKLEREVGSTDKVNIVAQLGRLQQDKLEKIYDKKGYKYKPTDIDGDWSGLRRYYVTQHDAPADSPVNNPILSECTAKLPSDVHMCEATTLADSLIDAMKKYPAKNYMVCMADHGGSILGAMTSDFTPRNHEIMDPTQIGKALQLAEQATGQKPALLDMAACLMASGEVAYQLRDRAEYYLSSQEVTSKTYQHYGSIMKDLVAASEAGTPMTPEQLGKRILHEYDDKPRVAPDKSLMKLDQVSQLKDTVTDLVGALRATEIKPLELEKAIAAAQHFGLHGDPVTGFSAHTRDLQGVAEKLGELAQRKGDERLATACQKVIESVKLTVVDNHSHDYQREEVIATGRSADGKEKTTTVMYYDGHYDAHGVSLFMPLNKVGMKDEAFAGLMDQKYSYLSFVKETGWGDYMVDFNNQCAEEKGKLGANKADMPDYNPETPEDHGWGKMLKNLSSAFGFKLPSLGTLPPKS